MSVLRRPECELIPFIGCKPHELPLHRVDPGDIGRNEMIAAALAGDHPKVAAGESRGRTGAAEMDEGGESCFCCGLALTSPARARTLPRCGPDTRTPVRWHG